MHSLLIYCRFPGGLARKPQDLSPGIQESNLGLIFSLQSKMNSSVTTQFCSSSVDLITFLSADSLRTTKS